MNELDDLLKSLRAPRPRASEIKRWKTAVRELRRHKASRWAELVAAMLVGVLIGGSLFRNSAHEENPGANATIERVITKFE